MQLQRGNKRIHRCLRIRCNVCPGVLVAGTIDHAQSHIAGAWIDKGRRWQVLDIAIGNVSGVDVGHAGLCVKVWRFALGSHVGALVVNVGSVQEYGVGAGVAQRGGITISDFLLRLFLKLPWKAADSALNRRYFDLLVAAHHARLPYLTE